MAPGNLKNYCDMRTHRVATGFLFPSALVARDFNGGGRADLAYARNEPGAIRVGVREW
jgi:hypothetical protein